MNCMNCGAFLADKDLDYCPHCGCNVLIQKKVEYLSKLYYNQGLEKASIRDLSGAVNCLKQSLTFNKRNIQARNLLGLVYFEMGEVDLKEFGHTLSLIFRHDVFLHMFQNVIVDRRTVAAGFCFTHNVSPFKTVAHPFNYLTSLL